MRTWKVILFIFTTFVIGFASGHSWVYYKVMPQLDEAQRQVEKASKVLDHYLKQERESGFWACAEHEKNRRRAKKVEDELKLKTRHIQITGWSQKHKAVRTVSLEWPQAFELLNILNIDYVMSGQDQTGPIQKFMIIVYKDEQENKLRFSCSFGKGWWYSEDEYFFLRNDFETKAQDFLDELKDVHIKKELKLP